MTKDTLSEIRKLAGMKQLNENYIYAQEEEDEGQMDDQHGLDMDTDGGHAAPHSHDEYDGEATMAKTQLHTIERAAEELEHILQSNENLPEWIQAKIVKACDYITMAKDTMSSRHEQGQVHKMGEATKPDYIDLDKDGDRKESMKKAAADKKNKDMDEDVTDEGNEFSGNLMSKKQIEEMRKLAGLPVMKNHMIEADHEAMDDEGVDFHIDNFKTFMNSPEEADHAIVCLYDAYKADRRAMKYDFREFLFRHKAQILKNLALVMKMDHPTISAEAVGTVVNYLYQDLRWPELSNIQKQTADKMDKGIGEMEHGDVHKMGEAAKPDYIDLDKDGDRKESMKKAAADKKNKDMDEDVTDEGNEFSGALAKAKAEHKDEFEVGGKTYKVKESVGSLDLMRTLAGLK
jgi:hypothetical protein